MAVVNLAVLTISNAQIQAPSNVAIQVDVDSDTGHHLTTSVSFAGSSTQAQMKTAILAQVKTAYLSVFPQDTISGTVNLVAFGAPI